MEYQIKNERMTAVISTHGAEPVSIVCDGRERLWQNENGVWAGHAPVLFPVCGFCRAVVAGKEYALGRHGFARNMEFMLAEKTESTARFELRDSDETRAVYPFAFVFSVCYALRGNVLEVTYEVKNPSDSPLCFACGGHISHALEEPFGEHVVVFAESEHFAALVHDDNGLLTGEVADMGMGKTLPLDENFFVKGRTLILGNIRSRAVRLVSNKRGTLAEIAFEGFENLLFWRPAGAQMVCIEPWQNLPDDADDKGTELSEKKGVQHVAPGGKVRFTQTVTYY